MMRSAEIDSRAASSRTARVASRLLYGPPNTIRGLSTRRSGIGLDIKPSPALCLAMIAPTSPYSATPGWGTNISAGIGRSDERPAPSGKSGPYVLLRALCTSAECRPEKAPRRMTEKGTLETERGRCWVVPQFESARDFVYLYGSVPHSIGAVRESSAVA